MAYNEPEKYWCQTCGVDISKDTFIYFGGNCKKCSLWWKEQLEKNPPDDS